MPPSRVALAAAVVVTALALQVTLLNGLPLPGAAPDLVLVSVVALGLAHGPSFGLVTGAVAGLAADLVPPADHTIGRWTLVLGLIGYAAGLAKGDTRRSAFVPVLVVALAAAGSVLLYAGLGALINDPHITWVAVSEVLTTAVLYDVVLSPFVVPAVLALVRRVEPEPLFRR
ncbi:MAG: rod shape-determining protein MreD [Nocardioidaceae bacterium]